MTKPLHGIGHPVDCNIRKKERKVEKYNELKEEL